MSRPASSPEVVPAQASRRRRFGLDTVLPADPAIIEAQVLRLLAEQSDVIVVRPSTTPERPARAGHRPGPALVPGAPDLLLLMPGGRTACLKIRAQAERLSRQEASFGDLCRDRAIPFAVIRSLAEARVALAGFGMTFKEA